MHMEGKGLQDASAALLWYETAANNGAPMAMNMLGRCHELGQGTTANPALAAVWYRRAADTGLDWGLYNLANLLATGRGVTQDRAQALALYTVRTPGPCQIDEPVGPPPRRRPGDRARSAAPGLVPARGRDRRFPWPGQLRLDPAAGRTDRPGRALAAAGAGARRPAFMAHIVPELAASPHPQVRALAAPPSL